jgi:hypothetical protein
MALQQNLCTADAWLTEADAKLPVINGNTLTRKRKKFERRESVLIFQSIDLFVLSKKNNVQKSIMKEIKEGIMIENRMEDTNK